MRPTTRPTSQFASLAAAALLLAGCAGRPPAAVSVATPDAIAAGPRERLAMTVAARGVQIYECRAANAGEAPQWRFVAPEAVLYDQRGRRIGDHGAGPYWQASDGSRLEGKLQARADAPRAGAIPWLLLSTTSSGATGMFSGVGHVQRVNTDGGLAPAAPCDAASIGRVERVPYTADYQMLRAAAVS